VHVRRGGWQGQSASPTFKRAPRPAAHRSTEMMLQVGGSISFAPEGEGTAAKVAGDRTRHMLDELLPQPDQVTIVITRIR